jgi:hypothetical protein
LKLITGLLETARARVQDAMGCLSICRLSSTKDLLELCRRRLAGERRSRSSADSSSEHARRREEEHDTPETAEHAPIARVDHDAAAGRDHRPRRRLERMDDVVLELPKTRLLAAFEHGLDGFSRQLSNHVIRVDELERNPFGEESAERSLSRTSRSDEDE